MARKWLTLAVLLALIVLAPMVFPSGYYYRVGASVFVNALAVVGLVILVGYAGQISLGHGAFCGIGAYACALAPVHLGLPPALAVVLGAVLSGAVAFVVGRPILRLKGYYLAVATLGLGILVAMVLANERDLTGGTDGIKAEDLGLRGILDDWFGLDLSSGEFSYWLNGLILFAGAWLALNLAGSATGRAMRALHGSEVAARAVGIDVAKVKLQAFVISAVYASVSGSLLAMQNRFVTPDVAGFLHSVQLVTMTVLGGAASVLGGIFGALVLTVLPQALTVFAEYEMMVLGAIMMLVMIFLPEGVLPSLVRKFGRRR